MVDEPGKPYPLAVGVGHDDNNLQRTFAELEALFQLHLLMGENRSKLTPGAGTFLFQRLEFRLSSFAVASQRPRNAPWVLGSSAFRGRGPG